MVYRPDIDGLRAIAVLAVIFFHAHAPGFAGGFVGVDVFFVISGFLITRIIDAELACQTFSFSHFYERRLRRIVPALAVMLLASLLPALLLLSPDDLKDFFQSLLATCLCSSNVLFWKEAGYFDTQADLKPLLHTWSLSVEEQFYLLYPVILVAFSRLPRPLLFIATTCGAAIIAYFSESCISADAAFAFYMLPARCWELLMGACVAVIAPALHQPETRIRVCVAEALAMAGIAMIGWSIATYDHSTPFPGVRAIPPTLGTALTILFSHHGMVVTRILSFPLLVRVGLMSYSLYLWHHPLFALARHASLGEPGAAAWVGISVLTAAAAFTSWTLVEQPSRSRDRISTARLLSGIAVAYLSLVTIGCIGAFYSAYVDAARLALLSPHTQTMITSRGALLADREASLTAFRNVEPSAFNGDSGTRKFLFLGDSMSEDLYGAVMLSRDVFPAIEVRRLSLDETCMGYLADRLTATSPRSPEPGDTCRIAAERVLNSSLFKSADVVVLCANWAQYGSHATHHDALRLAQTLADSGRQVRIVGLFAMQEASSIAFVSATRGLTPAEANALAFRTIHRTRIKTPNDAAQAICNERGDIEYLDKYAVFVDEARGLAQLYGEHGEMLFADNAHLTKDGLLYFGKQIARLGWFKFLLRHMHVVCAHLSDGGREAVIVQSHAGSED